MALTRPRLSQLSGSDYKDSCLAGTAGSNINLIGGAPNVLDGIPLAVESRILVKDQSDATQNGIYRVSVLGTGSNGTWVRADDAKYDSLVSCGMLTIIERGTYNSAGTQFKLTTPNPIILGTTNLTFVPNASEVNSVNGETGDISLSLNDVVVAGNTSTLSITISNATESTSTTTGALVVSGGVGVAGNVFVSNITANIGAFTTLSATGTFTGTNINAGTIGNTGATLTGTLATSSQPNITSVGTLSNLATSGDATIGGNLTVNGTTVTVNATTVTTNDKNIVVANNQSTSSGIDGAGIDAGGGTPIATWRYNNSTTSWQSNVGITPSANGTVSLGGASNYWNTIYSENYSGSTSTFTGNVTAGNVSATGIYFSGNGFSVGDMQTHIYDTNADGVVNSADFAATAPWSGISDKPLTYDPSPHTHVIANVTGLQDALDSKSNIGHTHVVANITDLQTALDGKANVSHTHTISNVTGLQDALDSKANVIHTHTIANITGLQTELDSKSNIGHTHVIANVTGLQDALDSKTTLSNVGTVTGDIQGIVDRTQTAISFDDATRVYTIAPTGTSWDYYYKGNLHTVSTTKTITIANTAGARFIRIDPDTGDLVEGGSVPDFANHVITSYIYYDTTSSKALIVGDERHGSKRDTTWHSAQHLNVGTVWRSGGSLTYTLNDAASIQIGVGTPLVLADEDLVHTITHSASPSADYQQVLTTAASLEVLYLSGTTYTATSPSTTPWIAGTSLARYNQVTGGSGSLVDASEGSYITYWLIGTNDIRRPVKLVLGRTAHASIDAAYAEAFEEYGLSFAEQVFMYQIVVQTSASYSNTPKIVIASVRKLTTRTTTAVSAISASSHNGLTGRDALDTHPIGAITNLQTTLDGKQATLVSNVNIKTVNSTSLLGSGDISIPTYDQSLNTNNSVTFANVAANSGTISTSTTTGALVVTGGAGISGNLNVGGNVEVASGSILHVGRSLQTTVYATTVAQFNSNVNSYQQVVMQNMNSGTSASSDYVATADTGSDIANYVDMGINSSGYNDAAFSITKPLDGYLYTNGGNLVIGTGTAGKNLVFHTGGTTSSNLRAVLSDTAFTINATTTSTSTTTGALVVNGGAGFGGNVTTANVVVTGNIYYSTSGTRAPKITVGTTAPTGPSIGDLWVDTN